MWTLDHRRAADRRGLRYPSDLTDDEWAIVAPGEVVLRVIEWRTRLVDPC